MKNRIKIILITLLGAVTAFAAPRTATKDTVCATKYSGVEVQLEGVHSPTPLSELQPLLLNFIALQDLSSLSVRGQGEGIFGGISISQDWPAQARAGVRKLSVPLTLTGASGFGRLRLQLEVHPSGSRQIFTRTLDISGYLADGQLYYGWENGVELQLQHIAALEASGSISGGEASARRAEVTTLRESTELQVVGSEPAPARSPAIAKSPTEALVISGQVQWKDHSSVNGTGKLFPVIGMHLQAYDKANTNTVLASAQTDRAGRYTLRIARDAVNTSSNAFNLLVRAVSQSTGFQIYSPGTTTLYAYEKTVSNVLNQATITANAAAFNVTFDKISGVAADVSAQNRVWAVYSALFLIKEFADSSSQLRYPPNLPCEFPVGGSASYYSSGTATIYILSADYADFDVIFHEYGHAIQDRFSLTSVPANPAGSSHSSVNDLIVTYDKNKGINMAWSEGMATALGMAMETEGNYGLTLAPRFGNQTYDDSEDSNISYPAETEGSRPNISEGNEATVMRILYDLFDGSGSGEDFDKVSWGFDTLVSNLKNSNAKNLSAFWLYISSLSSGYLYSSALPSGSTDVASVGRTVLDLYAPIFAKNNVAPDPISPKSKAELDAFTGDKVTFRWKQNINTVRGGLKFRVLIMNSAGTVLKRSDEVGGTTASIEQKLDVPKTLIQQARDAAGANAPLFWTIAGVDGAAPATGAYVGPAVPLDASGRILFVIDDTGSMSGEIGAVKQGLLSYLSRFDTNSTSTRFQLITFKDDVTPRASTTSLEEIKNQVGSLYASGGGDEPEASVEALWLGAMLLASEGSGGTIFLATDAPPHSGLSIPATIAVLHAAGIRVNVILTQYGFTKDTAAVARQQQDIAAKPGGTGTEPAGDPVSGADLAAMIPDTPFSGSTDAFGAIADGTGGVLIGLSKSDTTRIAAAVENLTVSGSFPALIQATPKSAPAGATLDVTIQGQNSNFDETSTVLFSRDIRVNSITRNSPVELSVNITITNTAAVGSVDITVKTGTEEAKGVKIFDITAATTSPTTLSVNPAVGSRGDTVRVSINGMNTHFTSNSVVSFVSSTYYSGTAVAVTNITASTSNQLTADLIIAADAPASYYSVTVDGVTKNQAFRVSSAAIADLASITSVQTNRVKQGAIKQNVTIYGQGTTFSSASRVNFSGLGVKADKVTFVNVTQLVAQVTVQSNAKPGFRDVFVTTGASTASGLQKLQIFQPAGKITISIVGNGTVAPNLDGTILAPGKTYVVTATPKKGAVFAGWSGDISTNNPKLTFTMRTNLYLEADFSTNLYPAIKANYSGLFYPTNQISPTNSGSFKLTLTDLGTFSGSLLLAGKTLPFTGQAYANGTAQVRVVQDKTSSLLINLQFDMTGADPVVRGQISAPAWTAVLDVDRVVTAAIPLAGTYTGVLPGLNTPTVSPAGYSTLTAVVLANGNVSVTGTLSDSVPVNQSGGITKHGEFPLYSTLYKGSGMLLGWLQFVTNGPNREIHGQDLVWQKLPVVTDKVYPAGFNLMTNLIGSAFKVPTKGTGVLNFSNAMLVVSGGNLTNEIRTGVQISNNMVKVRSGVLSNLSLTISTVNGAISGTFTDPQTRKVNKLTGVAVQGSNLGGGWFLGTNQSGSILLVPAP